MYAYFWGKEHAGLSVIFNSIANLFSIDKFVSLNSFQIQINLRLSFTFRH